MIFSSAVDKVVELFSPVAAGRRRAARHLLNKIDSVVARGYYDGDRKSRRLSEWVPGNSDANSDISYSLDDLRDDSNDLMKNSPLAIGVVDTYITNVVGTGLDLHPAIDRDFLGLSKEQAQQWQREARREWDLFCSTADITRTQSISELQELVFRSMLVNGDVFVNLPIKSRPGVVYRTCVQLIESHRVSDPQDGRDTKGITMGVETDRHGSPVRYWVRNQHPGSLPAHRIAAKWQSLAAFDSRGRRQVLHLFRRQRVDAVRGVPVLAPIMATLKQLDRYSDAEIDAAVVSALYAVFIKSDLPDADALDNFTSMGDELGSKTSDKDLKLAPGMVVSLDGGESIETTSPGRPNMNFEPFFKAVVSQIAIGTGLPFEVLMKQFNSSYSASRGAIIEAWKAFFAMRKWLTDKFCQPLYEAMLFEAVATGRLSAPGYLMDPRVQMAYARATWTGPAQGELDPLKEANAAKVRIDNGLSNLFLEAQRRGGRYEDVHEGAVEVKRMREEDGLSMNLEEQQADPTEDDEEKDDV